MVANPFACAGPHRTTRPLVREHARLPASGRDPTLPTLLRIALVFGVGLGYFFSQDTRAFAVVRRNERKRFPERRDASRVPFHFESLDFPVKKRKLDSYLADFQPAIIDDVKLHRHRGVEFIYVVEGTLGLHIRDSETKLVSGDRRRSAVP